MTPMPRSSPRSKPHLQQRLELALRAPPSPSPYHAAGQGWRHGMGQEPTSCQPPSVVTEAGDLLRVKDVTMAKYLSFQSAFAAFVA